MSRFLKQFVFVSAIIAILMIGGLAIYSATPQGNLKIVNVGGFGSATSTVNNPIGWWKLDEGTGLSALDSSGNGNTGTLTNGPTWTTGKVGNAINFDGSNDYVDLGKPAIFDGLTEMTVTAWVRRDRDAVNSQFVGDNSLATDGTISWRMRDLTNAFGGWAFVVGDGATQELGVSSPINMPAFGEWFLATGIFKGGQYIDACVNTTCSDGTLNNTCSNTKPK